MYVIAATVCALSATLFLATVSGAQSVQSIPDRTTCAACRISFDTLVVLGDLNGPGALPSMALAVARDSRGRFFVYKGYSSEVQVFSATGSFLARLGQLGSGPGEVREIARVLIGPGDTIHILDNALSRWTLFSPDLKYVRSVQTSVQVETVPAFILRSGELLLAQDLRRPKQFGFPMHVINRSGEVARSFGSTSQQGEYRTDIPDMLQRLVSIGPRGEVWAAHRARYRIDLLDPFTGKTVRSFERSARWFPPTDLRPSEDFTASNPPRTRVFDLMIDLQGRMWTHVSVADSRWRSAVRQRDATHIDIVDRIKYYDAVIEVLDPSERTVLASIRLDDSPGRFLAPDMMYGTRETDDGAVHLIVVRANLKSR